MSRVTVVSNTISTSGSFYGRETFNPSRIVLHVVAIQAAFYVSDAWIILLLDYTLNVDLAHPPEGRFSVLHRQMFDHRTPSLHTSAGVISIGAFYVAMVLCSSVAFAYFVGRSKRALDFSTTLLLVHLLVCASTYGFPTSPLWWFMMGSAGITMVLTSEMLARRLEMREIAVPPRDEENPSRDDDEDSVRPA